MNPYVLVGWVGRPWAACGSDWPEEVEWLPFNPTKRSGCLWVCWDCLRPAEFYGLSSCVVISYDASFISMGLLELSWVGPASSVPMLFVTLQSLLQETIVRRHLSHAWTAAWSPLTVRLHLDPTLKHIFWCTMLHVFSSTLLIVTCMS